MSLIEKAKESTFINCDGKMLRVQAVEDGAVLLVDEEEWLEFKLDEDDLKDCKFFKLIEF